MKIFKKIIILIISAFFLLSINVVHSKDNLILNGCINVIGETDVRGLRIYNYQFNQKNIVDDDFSVTDALLLETITVDNKELFKYEFCSEGNVLIVDIDTLPYGYGIDKKVVIVKSIYDDAIFTLSEVEKIDIINENVVLFNYDGDRVFAKIDITQNSDYQIVNCYDLKMEYYVNYYLDCIFDNDCRNDFENDLSYNNRSLPDIITDRTYQATYYGRFVIYYDNLTSSQLQLIADIMYDIEDYYTSSMSCQYPSTENNGLLYITCFDGNYDYFAYAQYLSLTYSYIYLDEKCFNEDMALNIRHMLAHEYFHTLQNYYFGGINISNRVWFYESSAEAASVIYLNNCISLTNDEKSFLSNTIQNNIRLFCLNSAFNTFSATDSLTTLTNANYRYYSFVFPLYIHQVYGGWSTFKKIFDRGNLLNSFDALNIYVDTLNYDCNYNITSFASLYQEFMTFFIDAKNNYNVSSFFSTIFDDNRIYNSNVMVNDYDSFSSKIVSPLSFAVYRFDHKNKTHLENTVVLEFSGDSIATISSNTKVVIKRGNSITGYTNVTSYNISSTNSVNTYNITFGLNDYDYCVVMVINKGTSSYNCSLSYDATYLPYDGAEYMIGCVNGSSIKYMTIPLDEYNCTTIYQNVYLYDALLNNLGQCFKIKENNNGQYYILTKATSYYPEDFPNMRIGINISNIHTICDGYNNDSIFGFYNVNSYYFKIYKYNYSSNVIKAVNFNNGSNLLDQLSSNGNIVLSSSFNNTYLEKWRFYPL